MRQTIVVAREDRPGDVRVVAYVVAGATGDVQVASLREFLGRDLPSFMVPAAFVMLDALPLTPNGKVDRAALPPPESGGGHPTTLAPEAAMGASVEADICRIVREVLGVRRVRALDDFFEIGGDSLKALYVLARIERELGKRVGHAVFLEERTPAGIAKAIREGRTENRYASLVPLHPRGGKPPLFCFHGGGGHVYYYRDLSKRLGPDQPFYGLQCRHADGRLPRQTRVEEMAEFYLTEMRQVQPEGPYYLSGASFGGKVAFEVAQQLRRNGDVVALVAMFDTWGPGYPRFRVGSALRSAGWVYQRVEHHLGSVLMLEPGARAAYLEDKAQKAVKEVKYRLALRRSRGQHTGNGASNTPAAIPTVDEGFIAIASRAYQPRYYPGKVLLFRSRQQPLGIHEDPTLGWGGLCAELVVHDVIGLHAAVVAEPRVRFLVDKFGPCLEEAQRTFG